VERALSFDVTRRFTAGPTVAARAAWPLGEGLVTVLFGPSGSGKTTLLRALAGLERPDAGHIRFGAETWFDAAARTFVPPQARGVGLLFQDYALFPHLTVAGNLAYGLHRAPRAEREARVAEVAARLGLTELLGRRPGALSGGQRQRVALARALATQPSVLLLDEPFGALDARVRQELRRWLRRLHDELHVTSVFVTHDQEEAFEVSDRVVLMNAGRIEQVGTPEQVFEEPASPFVMRFLGAVNVFRGRVDGGRAYVGDLEFSAPEAGQRSPAHVYVRPHELEIGHAAVPGSFAARVERVITLGAAVRVELSAGPYGERLEAEVDLRRSQALGLSPGDRVHLSPRRVRVFAGRELEQDSLTASGL